MMKWLDALSPLGRKLLVLASLGAAGGTEIASEAVCNFQSTSFTLDGTSLILALAGGYILGRRK